MSVIRPGDEQFHHSDGSHRWTGGPADPDEQQVWQQALRDHVAEHRETYDAGRYPDRRRPASG